MKLLITGCFGNLGRICIDTALAAGHSVRGCDVDSPANRRLARRYRDKIELVLGDIRDPELQTRCIGGVDAILHNAALLPPLTDTRPELAGQINVDASLALIKLAAAQTPAPRLVFPSSVTVFGPATPGETLRRADDPVIASDNYTSHKLAVENALYDRPQPWVILRVGVSVDARTLKTDRASFRKLLSANPDTPLEYVHPKDVAAAMCAAATNTEANHKILLIGGGQPCRTRHADFLGSAFAALGLRFPREIMGDHPYYTHWMDTAQAEALLQFQDHSFQDYQREIQQKLAPLRWLLWPVRPLLEAALPPLLKRV